MNPSVLYSTILVVALTLLAKVSGLLRDVVVAAQFGTSPEMDAYVVAVAILGLLLAWLKNPIQVTVVPTFTRDVAARGEAVAWRALSVLLNSSLGLVALVAAGGWLLAPFLVGTVAPGLAEETSRLAAGLTRVLMVTLVLLTLATFLSALLHSYRQFGRPGLISTVDNVVVVSALVVLAPGLGIHGLAVAALLGAAAQVLIQLPVVWRKRAHYVLGLDLADPTLRRMAGLSIPLLVGTGGAGLGKIVDRVFASLLPPGRLSALSYAHQLTYASFQLVVASVTTVLFPSLSRKASAAAYEDLTRKLVNALGLLFALVVPLSVGIAVLHDPLVRLVYQRGAFTEESARLTGQAVLFYALGLAGYSVSHVLSYAFYSVQNTRTPVMSGFLRLGVKVLLSALLLRPLAHGALALAESVSFAVKATALFVCLPRELKQASYRRLARSFAATSTIAAVMAVVVLAVAPVVEVVVDAGTSFPGTLLSLGASTLVGAGTYLGLSLALHPVELRHLYVLVRTGVVGLRRR